MADANIKAEAEVVVNTSGIGDAVKKATQQANDAADKATKKSRKSQTDEAAKAAKEQERIAKKRADAESKLLEKQAREKKRLEDAQIKESQRYNEKLLKAKQESAAKGTQAEIREQKKRAESERRLLEKQAADKKRLEEAQAREHERYQRRLTDANNREVHKRTQQELEAERKSLATRKKEQQAFWKSVRGFAAGAAAGGLAAGAVAVGTARGIAGVADAGTRLQKANDAKRRLVSIGLDAGMNESQIDSMQATVVAASTKYGKDISELVDGIDAAHSRFNLLNATLRDMDKLTGASTAKLMDFGDVIGMMGSAKQAFELSDEEMPAALSTILSGTSVGAINAKEFAGPFAPLMGSFALNTKQRGLAGLNAFVASAEGIGTGQFGGEESATRMKNMVSALNDSKVIAKLRAVGIKDFRAKDGTVDVGKFIEEAAKSKQFQSASTRQRIFIEDRAREGVETLMSAREKRIRRVEGAVDYESLSKTDPNAGANSVAKTLALFEKSGALNLDKLAAEEQARTITQMGNLNTQVEKVAGSFSKLLGWMDEHMGGAGSFAETWGGSLAAGGVGALVTKLVAGGGATAAGGAAAGGTAAAGAGAAGLGAAGLAAGAGILAATGAAAYGVTRGVDNALGWAGGKVGLSGRNPTEAMGAWASNLLLDIDARRAKLESYGNPTPKAPAAAGVSADGAAIVNELRKSTEVQKQVVQRLPQRPTPPVTGNRGAR